MIIHITLIILIAIAIIGNLDMEVWRAKPSQSFNRSHDSSIGSNVTVSKTRNIDGAQGEEIVVKTIKDKYANLDQFKGQQFNGKDAYETVGYLNSLYQGIRLMDLKRDWKKGEYDDKLQTIDNWVHLSRRNAFPDEITVRVDTRNAFSNYPIKHIFLNDLLEFQETGRNYKRFIN